MFKGRAAVTVEPFEGLTRDFVVALAHGWSVVVARADWVVDMGPGAGNEGGKIVFEGVPAKLVKHGASLTGQHLAKRVG